MGVISATDTTWWVVGYVIGGVVVLVVVALVVPILLLAKSIGTEATDINGGLEAAVRHTAALKELETTNDSAEKIVAGLRRGRNRLGG